MLKHFSSTISAAVYLHNFHFSTRIVEIKLSSFVGDENTNKDDESLLCNERNLFVPFIFKAFQSANYYRIDNKESGKKLPNEHQIASSEEFPFLWVSLALNYSFYRNTLPKKICWMAEKKCQRLEDAYQACFSKHKPRMFCKSKTLSWNPAVSREWTFKDSGIAIKNIPQLSARRKDEFSLSSNTVSDEDSLKIISDKLLVWSWNFYKFLMEILSTLTWAKKMCLAFNILAASMLACGLFSRNLKRHLWNVLRVTGQIFSLIHSSDVD